MADASGSYAVQHLPEWMAKSSFDFAAWRRLWVEQNPRNDRADLARLVMFVENARVIEREGVPGSLAELGVYKGTTAKLLHTLFPGARCGSSTRSRASTRATSPTSTGRRTAASGSTTSLAAVLRYVGASDRVRACKGYFRRRAPPCPAKSPSRWYTSTPT
jgi:hypothetical protein